MSEVSKKKSLYECHVFICTNQRDGGRECCGSKGSGELRNQLKIWARGKYGNRVRINNSGCFDFCSKGIVAVIYPEGEWLMNLTSGSLEELQKAISEKMDKK
jgi:(2Fe-2S) ferredoxin